MAEQQQDDWRKDRERDLLSGVHSVLEAIRSGRQIEKILVQNEGLSQRLDELYDTARRAKLPVQKVPIQALDRLAQRHQGVVAYVAPFTYIRLSEVLQQVHEAGREPFFIILDEVTDVKNVGAVARTAECAGADAMVVPMLGTAQLGTEALRASAGALQHIHVCREANLEKTVTFLQANGVRVVAITEKANKEIFYMDMAGPIAIVLGSEEHGISQGVLALVDGHARLPMLGKIGSLNVANASSIALYEVVRQRIWAAQEAKEAAE